MVRRIALFLTLLLTASVSMAAGLTASVDRKEIGRSDAVTLQVRYDDMAGFSAPDWSPLDREWDVVSKNQSQQISFNNGKNSSYTDWTLVLVPRRSGELLIPAIEFKGAKSDPIRIKVSDQANTKPVTSDNFYFEVEVSSGTHYVQEQLMYIERLYYTVTHDDANLSEFTVANARVVPLMEPKQYVTVIDGRRIGVYERRYAIIPEEAGTLVIPGQRFTARIPNRYDRFRGTSDTVVSKPIELNVQPIPASYPQAPWIPASQFSITEEFSRNNDEWHAGEPITRTMTIKANGLSSGQVPPIPMPEVKGLRYYPDQTQEDTQVGEQGMTTTVTQSVALVPTQAGPLTLPEIRIPWWNTLTNKVEYAVLPGRVIQVGDALSPAGTQPQASDNIVAPAENETSTSAAPTTNTANGIWPWIALALLGTNLVTLALLLMNYSRGPKTASDVQEKVGTAPDDKGLWRELRRACQNNDANDIRANLLTWASAVSGQPQRTLSDVAQWLNDVRVTAALQELDALLYSRQNNSAFNGQGIIRLLENALKQKEQTATESRLPDFYPQ